MKKYLFVLLIMFSAPTFSIQEHTVEYIDTLIERVERVDQDRLTTMEREWLQENLAHLKELNSPMFNDAKDIGHYNWALLWMILGGVSFALIFNWLVHKYMEWQPKRYSLDEWQHLLAKWDYGKGHITMEEAQLAKGIAIKVGLTQIGITFMATMFATLGA